MSWLWGKILTAWRASTILGPQIPAGEPEEEQERGGGQKQKTSTFLIRKLKIPSIFSLFSSSAARLASFSHFLTFARLVTILQPCV